MIVQVAQMTDRSQLMDFTLWLITSHACLMTNMDELSERGVE